MSRILASRSVANRRSFLGLAVVTAAIVPMSGSAVALDTRDHHSIRTARSDAGKMAAREQKTLQTAAVLRDLWIDHIFWVRNVSCAAIDKNDLAVKAAEQQAVKNAQAIAASIEPFYGAGAKESFFKLLAGHYGAVKAYLVATVASDASCSSGGNSGSYLKRGRHRVVFEQSKSVLAKGCGGGSSARAWRSSHPADPATEGSQLRGRGQHMGRDEEARLSDSRRDR